MAIEKKLKAEISIKLYYCHNCHQMFIPKYIRDILKGKKQQIEPERCTLCNSRWWKIEEKDRVQCQRCGYMIDQSKYTGKLPKKCPNCGKANYTKKFLERYCNYSKEIRQKLIQEWKDQKLVKKKSKNETKLNERKDNIKFVNTLLDKQEDIEGRLL